MSWPASLSIGVLTALVALVLSGYFADLAADWYSVSSFEGAAGYFVVMLAILGFAVGFVIGTVTARLLPAAAGAGYVATLGTALGVSAGLILLIAFLARVRADVPPRLDGEALHLSVELQWPEDFDPGLLPDTAAWFVRLSAMNGRRVRLSRLGPLWREDARWQDDRWTVPGAVEIFTSRGERLVDVIPSDVVTRGFVVPLPGNPGRRHLDWSDWLPGPGDESAGSESGVRLRFRVVPRNLPVRSESYGPYEVFTVADGFSTVDRAEADADWVAYGSFEIHHRGSPVLESDLGFGTQSRVSPARFAAVAAVGGKFALLTQIEDPEGGRCLLLAEDAQGAMSVTPLSRCAREPAGSFLAQDPTDFDRVKTVVHLVGRFDRKRFASPGLYLFEDAVLDTRDLSVRPFDTGNLSLVEWMPPLGASPDGRSVVMIGYAADQPSLLVFGPDRDSSYVLPIDDERMRMTEIRRIDPAWVHHHFRWARRSDGRDYLSARDHFDPMPWQGTLSQDVDGYREYLLMPAKAGLRDSLIAFLADEFGAEVLPHPQDAYARGLLISGSTVWVAWDENARHVGLWMDRGADTRLVEVIARAFDQALRSGRFDALFGA